MTHSKFLILFISFITFFYSCKDEVEPTINYSTPDVEDIVMYEINIRCFSNTADFQGIIARLDSIQALGINTIWLMPIHPVGQLNSVGGLGSPYSVQNYTEVNSEFGSLVVFEILFTYCHYRNIAVILDWWQIIPPGIIPGLQIQIGILKMEVEILFLLWAPVGTMLQILIFPMMICVLP